MWAPNAFATAGVTDRGEAWLIKKAIYGLREAPRAWGDERDSQLRVITIWSWNMPHRLKQLATDTSVWAVIKQPTDFFKEKNTKLFLPVPMRLLIKAFLGDMMVGVMITYVDDVLAVGPKSIVAPVVSVVKKIWTCSDGEYTYNDQLILFCATRIKR